MHNPRASRETVRARAQLQLEAKTIANAKTALPGPSTSINGLREATNDKAQSPVSYGLSGRLRQLQGVLDLRRRHRTRSFARRDDQLDGVDDLAGEGVAGWPRRSPHLCDGLQARSTHLRKIKDESQKSESHMPSKTNRKEQSRNARGVKRKAQGAIAKTQSQGKSGHWPIDNHWLPPLRE